MQRLQHGLRVGFGDAQEGAGGAFGAAVALLLVIVEVRRDCAEGERWEDAVEIAL